MKKPDRASSRYIDFKSIQRALCIPLMQREGSWMIPSSSLSRMEVLQRSLATHTLMENAKVDLT
jgi:hypothetical protein